MDAEQFEVVEDRVERESLLDADPADVWRALTDPDELAWLGDRPEVELEPGGELAIEIDGSRHEGWVEEVDPERRLVVWWAAEGEESSRVTFDLEPLEDGGTRLRVIEARPLIAIDASGPELGGAAAGHGPTAMAAGPVLAGAR